MEGAGNESELDRHTHFVRDPKKPGDRQRPV